MIRNGEIGLVTAVNTQEVSDFPNPLCAIMPALNHGIRGHGAANCQNNMTSFELSLPPATTLTCVNFGNTC